jgi:hypothetical protein
MPHYRLLMVYLPVFAVLLATAVQALAAHPSLIKTPALRWATTIALVMLLLGTLSRHVEGAVPFFKLIPTEPCWQVLAGVIRPPSPTMALTIASGWLALPAAKSAHHSVLGACSSVSANQSRALVALRCVVW